SGWAENILHSFTSGSDGFQPSSGVTFDSSSNLYSSTAGAECDGGGGNAFELSAGSWSFSTVYCFVGIEGGGPYLSTMVFDQAGNLYGTTYYDGANGANSSGTVFKLTPSNGIWTYTSLHDFTGGTDGGYPVGNLVFDANGNLYGTASRGGDMSNCGGHGCGVVFKISGL
ncbi:MAG: choice-of-anchor tandem repeat GloVer-containing protein, partial [Candidatus Korobacteraceae bacterium]